MDLFTLAAKLTVDSSEFTKGLQDANTKGSNLSSKLSGVIKVAKKVAGALVFKKGVESLKALADQAAQAGDRIDKQSQALGMSRQAFQEWDYILSQSGASIDSLGVAMKTMNTNILEGKDSVGKLGLSFEDLKKMSPEQQFDAVVKAFQQMPEGAEKSALAVEMFGKQGQSLLPLLNSSTESIDALRQKFSDLGIAMTDDMIDSAVHYTDAMDTMNRTLDAAKIMIGSELLPVMTDWITHATNYAGKLVSAYKEGGISEVFKTLKGDFEGFVQSLKENDNPVLQTMGKALDILLQTVETIVGLFTDFPGTIEKLKQSDNPILQLLAGSIENLKNIFDITVGLITDFPGTVEKLKSSDNPVLQVLGNSIEIVKGIIETVIGLFTNFDGTVAKLQASDNPVLQTMGNALSTIKSVFDGIVSLFTNFDGTVATLQASDNPVLQTLGGALVVIKDAFDTLVSLFTNFDGTVATLQKSDNPVLQVLGTALLNIKENFDLLVGLFTDFSGTVTTLQQSDNPVLQVMGKALETIKSVFDGLVKLFTDFSGTVATLQESDNPVLQVLGGALTTIKDVFSTLVGLFTDFSGTVATLQKSDNPVLQALGNAIETIRSTFDSIVGLFVNFSGTVATLQESDNPVLQVLGSALATIKGVIDAIVSAFTSGISDAIATLQQSDNPVLQVLGNALSTIKNTIDAIIGFFNTGFSEAVKKLQESDNPVLKVLGDSIAAIKSTIDGVSSAVETVIGWFQKLLGYDGKNLASTTSSHTHTETTVKKVVNADGTTSTIATDKEGREQRTDSDGSGGASRGFAKGSVFIPNDMTAMLHRGEMVLTASQARKYRDNGSGIDYGNLAQVVAQAVREGMAGVSVNSYLDAELVTESVNRRIGNELVSRRYAT